MFSNSGALKLRGFTNLVYHTPKEPGSQSPQLSLEVLKEAGIEGLPGYFFGSKKSALDKPVENMSDWFPK
jgi:hypothetical protein